MQNSGHVSRLEVDEVDHQVAYGVAHYPQLVAVVARLLVSSLEARAGEVHHSAATVAVGQLPVKVKQHEVATWYETEIGAFSGSGKLLQ